MTATNRSILLLERLFLATAKSRTTLARTTTLLVCAAALIGSTPAWSQANVNESEETATLWVDASKGSDSNPGTQQLPLKTIGAAATLAVANNQVSIGTKVIINPGTYREAITLQYGATATSLPMTFEAATNGTVVVSGADVWTGWQGYSKNPSIYITAWPYQWGLCPVDSGVPPFQQNIVLRREMILVNGTPLTEVLSQSAMVVGTFYVDEKGGTVYIWPPTGTNMSTATIEVSTRPSLFVIEDMSNIVLRGLTFQYAGSCYVGEAVGTTTGTSNILFDTDSFNWNNAMGLWLAETTNVTVQNSIADHNGRSGTADNRLKYGLYQNNTASYNNWRGSQGVYYSWGNAGAHFVEAHDDTVQGYNLFFNETFGAHWDTDNANITANGIIAAENLGAAAFVEKSEGPIAISSSYLCNGNPPVGATTVGFDLRNSELVTLNSDTLANNVENFLVEGVSGGIQVTNWETGQVYNLISQNFSSTNNVFVNGQAQQLVLDSYLGGSDWATFQGTLVSDYNTWWNGSQTNPFMLPVPTNYTSTNFAGWQSSTLQDQHSLYQAPSGSYDGPCQVAPVGSDFWFFTGNKSGVQTVAPGSGISVKATVNPLAFSGTVNLSSDGVQSIPGATASWSPTSINTSGTSTFTLTTGKTTPPGNYPVTLIATSGSLTRTMTVSALVNTSVALVPLNLSFSSQNVGTTSSPGLVNLVNEGSSTLSISDITTTGAFAQTNTCGTSLPAGATCELFVTFNPTGPGTLTGSLKIEDGDPTSPQTVALTGIGAGVPAVALSPTSLSFGNQEVNTSSPPQKVTLTNNGSASLSMTGITVAGASFTETNNCGTSVPAGKSCVISVTFTPPGSGSKTGTIYITDSANPPNQMVSLSGTGTQPVVTLSPSSLVFGNQEVGTSSPPQKVTLTNTSGGNLNITGITVAGASFTETNNCGTSVPVGGSCTISVTFAPLGAGSKTGSVYVTDNANPPNQTISLSGTGTQPQVSLSKAYIAFGNQKVGTTSSAQTLTLSNIGTGTLNISSIAMSGTNPGDFAQSNTCGSYLAAGASCTITATFTPAATGMRSASVLLTANINNSPLAITLTGYGD
jgi:hypothetical protein